MYQLVFVLCAIVLALAFIDSNRIGNVKELRNQVPKLQNESKAAKIELHDLKVRYLELLSHYKIICNSIKLPDEFQIKNSPDSENIEKAFNQLRKEVINE